MLLLELPHELLGHVAAFLIPEDVVHFGQTCRSANTLISPSNQVLWRDAFLHVYDDPKDAWSRLPQSYDVPNKAWDWHQELKQRQLSLRILFNKYPRRADIEEGTDPVTSLLSIIDTIKFAPTRAEISQGKLLEVDDRSSPILQRLGDPHSYQRGMDFLIHEYFSNEPSQTRESYTWPGRPMTRARAVSTQSSARTEAASRLHVLHGLTNKERTDYKLRNQARQKVYDWDNTSQKTDYGPFAFDNTGKVNWPLLESVMCLICHCFECCIQGQLALPTGLCYSIPHRTLVPPTTQHDWARVQGSWLGTYAFVPYENLLAYNGGPVMGHATRDLNTAQDLIGDVLKMELMVDESVKDDGKLKTEIPSAEDPDYPTLYFRGLSRGQGQNGSPMTSVKGFTSLIPGGREVRWKFIIAYGGSDQWQLEGVQPGGIRSGGIYGLWSQVDHEPAGPVGPFCYFPIELCKPTSIVLVSG